MHKHAPYQGCSRERQRVSTSVRFSAQFRQFFAKFESGSFAKFASPAARERKEQKIVFGQHSQSFRNPTFNFNSPPISPPLRAPPSPVVSAKTEAGRIAKGLLKTEKPRRTECNSTKPKDRQRHGDQNGRQERDVVCCGKTDLERSNAGDLGSRLPFESFQLRLCRGQLRGWRNSISISTDERVRVREMHAQKETENGGWETQQTAVEHTRSFKAAESSPPPNPPNPPKLKPPTLAPAPPLAPALEGSPAGRGPSLSGVGTNTKGVTEGAALAAGLVAADFGSRDKAFT